MVIKRDKLFEEYKPIDFVKYFARRYTEIYKIKFSVVYARDCVLMGRVMGQFVKGKKPLREIFSFIDKMFAEYSNRDRVVSIDMRFLIAMLPKYLRTKDNRDYKAKQSPTVLTLEMKEWLKQEKEKWLKDKK